MRILILILVTWVLSLSAVSSEVDTTTEAIKRDQVWKEFHEVRYKMFGKFQDVDVYAENKNLTRICYISNGQVFMYYHKDPNNNGVSRVERVMHGKVISPRINRITYRTSENTRAGAFILWYYETAELSIGSS